MKIYKTRLVQSLMVLTLCFFTVSTASSMPELMIALERWNFQVQPGNYLVRFTIKLSNGYERPIERIDAFLTFKDGLTNRLGEVYINPYFKIPPGKSRENTWTYIMNPFSALLKMKPDEIRVKLVVRGITFSTGEKMAFTMGSDVIY